MKTICTECGAEKTVLPLVFERRMENNLTVTRRNGTHSAVCGPRISGEFADRGLWLSDEVDWKIEIDSEGMTVLNAYPKGV